MLFTYPRYGNVKKILWDKTDFSSNFIKDNKYIPSYAAP